MSIPQKPRPVKLLTGVLLKDEALISSLCRDLVDALGELDMVSPWFPFDYTSYYEPEMGSPLFRRIFVFRKLISPERLPEIKIITNRIEQRFSEEGKRKVNIDPGYLNHARLVLATGKDYSHRIYIGKGIYGDLTLMYQKGGFQTLPWTYPDYAAPEMREYLMRVRHKYSYDLKKESFE